MVTKFQTNPVQNCNKKRTFTIYLNFKGEYFMNSVNFWGVIIGFFMNSVYFWGVIIVVIILYLFLAIRWVNNPFHWIVEMNFPGGMHPYVWEPGLRMLWLPIKPFMFVKNKVDMAQKPVTIHMGIKAGIGRPDPVDFKDTKAGVLVQVIYRVIDAIKATYHVQESDLSIVSHDDTGRETLLLYRGYERATLNRIEAELRSFFGSFEFDDANQDSKKSEIELAVLGKIKRDILDNWGVEVLLIDIIDFVLDEKTAEIRQGRLTAKVTAEVLATTAEGEKKAAITIAEGRKQATITVAEGDQMAAQLAGQGEKERLQAVASAGLDSVHAAAYVIARGANESIAKGNATIIATSEGGNMAFPATMAGLVKGMMGGGNQNPSPAAPTATDGTPSPTTPTGTPSGTSPPQTPLSTRRRGSKT